MPGVVSFAIVVNVNRLRDLALGLLVGGKTNSRVRRRVCMTGVGWVPTSWSADADSVKARKSLQRSLGEMGKIWLRCGSFDQAQGPMP
jgi:hypothetical protein